MEKTAVAMKTATWTDLIIPLLSGNLITFVKISHTDLDSVKVKTLSGSLKVYKASRAGLLTGFQDH